MNVPKKPHAYEGSEPYLFVSYRHTEREVAYPIIRRLNEAGFRVWYDEGIHTGTPYWNDVIAVRVENCTVLLALCSKAFFESEHCRRELEYAKKLGHTIHWYNIEPLADKDIPAGIRMDFNMTHKTDIFAMTDDDLYQELMCGQDMEKCLESRRLTSRHQPPKEQAPPPKEICLPQKKTDEQADQEEFLAFLKMMIPSVTTALAVLLSWKLGDAAFAMVIVLLAITIVIMPIATRQMKEHVAIDCIRCHTIPYLLCCLAISNAYLVQIWQPMPWIISAEMIILSLLPPIVQQFPSLDREKKHEVIIWTILAAVALCIVNTCLFLLNSILYIPFFFLFLWSLLKISRAMGWEE